MEGYDLALGGLGALATLLLFSGFDVVAAGQISWAVNAGLALVVGAVVVYFRTVEDA